MVPILCYSPPNSFYPRNTQEQCLVGADPLHFLMYPQLSKGDRLPCLLPYFHIQVPAGGTPQWPTVSGEEEGGPEG